jgi:hypothetical protein
MMDLPELARDATESVERQARNLLPWIETPLACETCNQLCIADVTFDPQQALYVDSWYCENCDRHFYRQEDWKEDNTYAPDFSR